MDKKSNAILSKNQCIIEHMKSQPGLIGTETQNNQTNPIKKQKPSGGSNEAVISNVSAVVQAFAITETQPKKSPAVETIPTSAQEPVVALTQSENGNEDSPSQAKKRDLTSGILQNIETRFLKNNVRVKSFSGVKIDDLKHKLSQMKLSRYQNIVLHVGGHYVDAYINRTSFRDEFSSLLNYVSQHNCNVFVSGLLPRGGKNVKPFYEILADLCKSTKA